MGEITVTVGSIKTLGGVPNQSRDRKVAALKGIFRGSLWAAEKSVIIFGDYCILSKTAGRLRRRYTTTQSRRSCAF